MISLNQLFLTFRKKSQLFLIAMKRTFAVTYNVKHIIFHSMFEDDK